jgi:hypothetical protein
VKSFPKYFLMVLALAGDSTMTKFLLIAISSSIDADVTFFVPVNKIYTGYMDGYVRQRLVVRLLSPRLHLSLVQPSGSSLKDEVLHPGEGGFLAGLVEQDHEDDPLEVGEIGFVRFEGHDAVDHQLTA